MTNQNGLEDLNYFRAIMATRSSGETSLPPNLFRLFGTRNYITRKYNVIKSHTVPIIRPLLQKKLQLVSTQQKYVNFLWHKCQNISDILRDQSCHYPLHMTTPIVPIPCHMTYPKILIPFFFRSISHLLLFLTSSLFPSRPKPLHALLFHPLLSTCPAKKLTLLDFIAS